MDNKFEREVLERLIKIETKIDDYKSLKEKTDEAFNLSMKNCEDIKDLQDKNKWLTRTIAGALITGAVGMVFILIKISVGIN